MAAAAKPQATVEDVLALCRRLVRARDARVVSQEHFTISLLIDAVRTLPEWLLPPVIEPAAEVERQLACGASMALRNEDGTLVMVVRTEEITEAVALTREEALQARADLARVLAAIGGKP